MKSGYGARLIAIHTEARGMIRGHNARITVCRHSRESGFDSHITADPTIDHVNKFLVAGDVTSLGYTLGEDCGLIWHRKTAKWFKHRMCDATGVEIENIGPLTSLFPRGL